MSFVMAAILTVAGGRGNLHLDGGRADFEVERQPAGGFAVQLDGYPLGRFDPGLRDPGVADGGVLDVLAGRRPRWPVNAPALGLDEMDTVSRYLPLAEHIGRVHAALLEAAPNEVDVEVHGPLDQDHLEIIMGHALAGMLDRIAGEEVNYVNAAVVADERGIRHDVMRLLGDEVAVERHGYAEFVTVTVTDSDGERSVSGALLDMREPHIVSVAGFEMDLPTQDVALLVWNARPEAPGFVAKIGAVLGDAKINIQGLQVSLDLVGGQGLMAVTVAEPVPPAVLVSIDDLPDVVRTRLVEFPS